MGRNKEAAANSSNSYMKGFVPFAVAAAVMSLCGGFTAAVPTNVASDWDMSTAVTWITLAYSLGAATLAPIMGKLGDAFGRRRILLVAMGLYTIGELLIAVCPTGVLPGMLLFRFVVGVGAAGISPCVMSYIMTKFPPEKLGQGFSIYMVIGSGMVIFGPVLGGIILTFTSWRVVMWVCVVICVIGFLFCFFRVEKEELKTKQTMKGFDFPGAVFSLIFFAMMLSIPTFGQNNGWLSRNTLVCIAVGVVALIILIVIERKAENPILNGKFMKRKEFILPVIVLFLSQGLLQACMTNIIYFSLYALGDSTMSGISTSIMYVGMALGAILIGPQSDKREPRVVAACALIFTAVGAALQLLITGSSGIPIMAAALFLIGLGLGGNTSIFMKVALSGLAPQMASSGSGTYNVFRDISNPVGVAIFVPMFTSGMAVRSAALVSDGVAEAEATVQGAVSALHSTAIVQVVCVVIGIIVCLMIPKIHTKKAPASSADTAEAAEA